MTDSVRDAAIAWATAGFCVLPTKHNDKAPMVNTWRQYVKQKGSVSIPAPPAVQMVDRWFTEPQTGLGLILGATSGNAEMFEFEGRALSEGLLGDFTAFAETNGAGEIWARLRGGYVEQTPSGGLHFVFRVSDGPALGNTRLAARPSTPEELERNPDQPIQVLIETRGEGGFVVIAPSAVVSNGTSRWSHIPAGQRGYWSVARGDVSSVVSLTVDERDQLYAVARMFNTVPEYVKKPVDEAARQERLLAGRLSPLDDFRARTDWADILEPEGWTYVGLKSDGRTAWLRPGKDTGEGWGLSATTGNTDGVSDSLYVFSTSTDLPVGQGLSKEYVWAHYNAGGDMHEAVRLLAGDGYGDPSWKPSKVVAGCVDPFSEHFDPAAWAAAKAVETPGPAMAKMETETGETVESLFIDWHALWAEPEDEEWVVEGLIPARRAVALYSGPKIGKSLMLLEMAVRVSKGEPFLGMPTRLSRVLYVDHENDPRGDIRTRLKAMGFGPDDLGGLRYMSFPQMSMLDTEAGGRELIQFAAQAKAELVVIDTVSRTIAGPENENDTWLAFYRHTGKLLKAAGLTYVRLDHTGKDVTKGQRGGSAKSGDVDVVWQLVRNGNTFTLLLDMARIRFPEQAVSFRREQNPLRSERLLDPNGSTRGADGQFTGRVDQADKVRARMAADIKAFLEVPGTTSGTTQLVRLIKGTDTVVKEVLERLIEQNFVVREPVGLNGHLNRWNTARTSAWESCENPFYRDPLD